MRNNHRGMSLVVPDAVDEFVSMPVLLTKGECTVLLASEIAAKSKRIEHFRVVHNTAWQAR